LGFWEVGMGKQLGEGWDKRGQSTSNLRRGRTGPVTAGGSQVSEGKHKGEQKGTTRGAKGVEEGVRKKATPCIYAIVTCALRMIEG
jgi:hypothetical protein